jgi:membrane-bound lytic murein transglycosylase D
VKRFVDRYQTRDRASVERVAGSRREDFNLMRSIFEEQKLPPDLAYMVLVESAFITQSASPKGAAGLWQFTPATARAYGMKVGDEVDERLDLVKSTHAASKYIRDLILDFGAGSSVMLALAAYNLGPGKVRRAVRRVQDPIKQRNFWYLYRVRALPLETRQYVPKIVAAIIIGRNLEQFGF